MPTPDDLLADGSDDQRRLVWADAVGGERGELVVAQLALEAGVDDAVKAGQLRARVRELLRLNERAWTVGLTGIATRVQFRGGFVDAVEVSLRAFLEHADRLFREAPLLRSLTVTDLGGTVIQRESLQTRRAECLEWLNGLLARVRLSRLQTLDLGPAVIGVERDSEMHPIEWHDFSADANERIATSGAFRQLKGAHLHLTHSSDLLAQMYSLGALTHARITLPADGSFPEFLSRQLTSLRVLELDRPVDPAAIPPSVSSLCLQQVDQMTFEQLARSPVAPRLERLTLQRSRIEDPSALGEFRNLTALDLTDMRFGKYGSRGSEPHVIDWLAKVQLPRLRELRCTGLDTAMASTLARAFGARLESLDVSSSRTIDAAVLKRFVAGEVVVGPSSER